MKTVEIDHIIPERLITRPDELSAVLQDLGRPPDFDLNSYANWLPCCRPCNGSKSKMVWQPSPLIQRLLQRAESRAPRAQRLAEGLLSERRIYEALSTLESLSETRPLSEEEKARLRPLIEVQSQVRSEARSGEPIRVTPTYEVSLFETVAIKEGLTVVTTRFGVGSGFSERTADVLCPQCGGAYFNGARCLLCGSLDD